jgi:hypothetical protein
MAKLMADRKLDQGSDPEGGIWTRILLSCQFPGYEHLLVRGAGAPSGLSSPSSAPAIPVIWISACLAYRYETQHCWDSGSRQPLGVTAGGRESLLPDRGPDQLFSGWALDQMGHLNNAWTIFLDNKAPDQQAMSRVWHA